MKTLVLTLTLAIIVLISCKKDELVSEQPSDNNSPAYVSSTTVGSYWVYERYTVDSLGNETYGGVDTLFVTGDSVINGNNFTVYNSVNNTVPHPNFLRDSSGYLINETGTTIFSYVNLGDTLSSYAGYFPGFDGNDYLYRDLYMLPNQTNISTQAGQFNCYVKRIAVRDSAGGPINVCGDTHVYGEQYYSSNVGLIRYENWYHSAMIAACQWFYFELVDYYIAP